MHNNDAVVLILGTVIGLCVYDALRNGLWENGETEIEKQAFEWEIKFVKNRDPFVY